VRLEPDWGTLRVCSWHAKTALVLCDAIDEQSHTRLDVAPRTILRARVDDAARMGFTVMAATELEYYGYKTSYAAARALHYMVCVCTEWNAHCNTPGRMAHGLGLCYCRAWSR
jgi:glutamine synthetase